jgi:YHS domain-containing protein
MSDDSRCAKDPVCGRRMNRDKAYGVARFNGVEYLLCCPRCQSEFEADPERYEAASLALNRGPRI